MTFNELVDKHGLEPNDLTRRYGVPLRTVYTWYQGTRKPPEYLLSMIDRLETSHHGKEKRQ